MMEKCHVMQSWDCECWLRLNFNTCHSNDLCFNHFLGITKASSFGFLDNYEQANKVTNMGGENPRVELTDCEVIRNNSKLWERLEKGVITIFIDKIHGWDSNITKCFAKGWEDGEIILFGRKVAINEQLIAEVTGLPMDGIKFYRDRKLSDQVVLKFPKFEKEKEDL